MGNPHKKNNKQKPINQYVGIKPIPDEAMELVRALKDKWQDYTEAVIYQVLKECNMSYPEADKLFVRQEILNIMNDRFSYKKNDDQFPKAKSELRKKLMAARKGSNSSSACRPGQESGGELLSSKHPVPISSVESQTSNIPASQDVAASASYVLEPPISSNPYSGLGDQLSYSEIGRGATVNNHNEVSRSENSAASGPSVLEPSTTSKHCSDLGLQLSGVRVRQDAIVEDHNEERLNTMNERVGFCKKLDDQFYKRKSERQKEILAEIERNNCSSSCGLGQGDSTPLCATEGLGGELLSSKDPVPIISVKSQTSNIPACQDVCHKDFLAASDSSVSKPPTSFKPYSGLGYRPSHSEITRGATAKNHNEVSRSVNSAASGPSVLEPPTTSKHCSDLGLQLSGQRVRQDAIVEDHNEGRVGESRKSLPNNSSVGGVGTTETLPSTNAQNLCSAPPATNLPESERHPNAAQANSQQVYADALVYDPWRSRLVGMLLDVLRTRMAKQSERRNSENYGDQTLGNSQATSHGQSHHQGAHQEQNPGRSSDDSNLGQSQMGTSQGYQDQTLPSDTSRSNSEAPSRGQPHQPRKN